MFVVVDRRFGRQTGDVCEELPERDGVFAARCELGNVAGRPIVQVELALVDEDHE
jgi:hypothetical protein